MADLLRKRLRLGKPWRGVYACAAHPSKSSPLQQNRHFVSPLPQLASAVQNSLFPLRTASRKRPALFHAYYVDEMADGDKAYYTYQGTSTLKDGAAQTEQGTWTLVGGTGKLKGIKGRGTYKGKADADGSMTYEIEGTYEAPTK